MKRALFIISIAFLIILPSRQVYSQEMVDLGLPSGTLWKQCGEDGYYTKYDALVKYSYELPTETQIKELIKYCKWSWQGGRYKVIGPNGKYIFMEANGYKEVFDTKVYKSTDDILKSASDQRDRGVYVSEENIAEVGRQGVYVYANNGSSKPKLFKFDYINNSFLVDYSFEDKSSYRGKYSYRVSVHLVNSDNRAVKYSDNLFKQCERRGLPLTDISDFNTYSLKNGQISSIGYTDSKKDPSISASVIKKNNQEGYWVCTWKYNFAFTADGKIKSNRIASYASSTITIPRKIRLGDYEWNGKIASSYDFSRPKSYFSNREVWVNRVQITPPDNVTKIMFEDGYINEALINLNYSSTVEEIHFPNSLKDFELFGMSSSDVLIFLPIKEPWEVIDGKRVPLFCGDECNTKFSEKCVFIVPKGSVEEYKKIIRFKNARIYSSIPEEYWVEKNKRAEQKKAKEEQDRKRKEKERLERDKYQQLVRDNKHLYTPDELKKIEGGYISTSSISYYKELMNERQKIYNLINQHPELFPPDYYLEVITKNTNWQKKTDLKKAEKQVNDVINKAKNYNRLVGEWKSEKGIGNKCVITSRNNQLYLTLKYKWGVLYEGRITDTNTLEGGVNKVYCEIGADTIIIFVNVFHKENSSTTRVGGYWSQNSGHTVDIHYRLAFEKWEFVLYVRKDGKETDKIVFRKKESK